MIHKTRKLTMEKDMLFVASLFIKDNPSQIIYSCRNLQDLELLKSFVEHLNSNWNYEGRFVTVPKQDIDLDRNIYTEHQIHYLIGDVSYNINFKEFNYSNLGTRYRQILNKWCDYIILTTATKHFEKVSSKYLAFEKKNNISFSSGRFETNYDYIQIC